MTRFLGEPDVAGYAALFGSTVVKAAVDDVLRDARACVVHDRRAVPAYDALLTGLRSRLAQVETESLVPALNGSGILLHTNLGRAPLAPEAVEAMRTIGEGYSNLEFDLQAGVRHSRYARLGSLLRSTTGAEDGLVVNNGAAAVLLVLDTFAKGREVIVSRNQLIEIGGGFRLPDVLARSGATLVEVGATNKVYVRDFERALTVDTALLLRSHTSNYRIEGFTADVAARDLAALGRRAGVPSVEDLGSGALVDLASFGLPHERTVREAITDGVDMVVFSGDKLLGGPQAGIVAGGAASIARLRANPLLRALRVDKATLAALAATLRCYLEPQGHLRIPFYAMLATPVERLRERARALAARCDARGEIVAADIEAYAGGGAAPLAPVASAGLVVRTARKSAPEVASEMRAREPRVVARIAHDATIVDLRAIPEARDGDVATALVRALA